MKTQKEIRKEFNVGNIPNGETKEERVHRQLVEEMMGD